MVVSYLQDRGASFREHADANAFPYYNKRCQSESEFSEFRHCPNTDSVFGRTATDFLGQFRTNTVTYLVTFI